MNAKDYRRQVEADLQQSSAAGPAPASEESPDLNELVAMLADTNEHPANRQNALQMLQAASFLGPQFNAVRPAFVQALRDGAVGADEQLRRSALDMLSNIKDQFAQEKLKAGLTGAIEPLVPAAVALGFLARDDHASLSNIARQVVENSADRFAKAQAVRILGSDPNAKSLLANILSDKTEFREVRRASATALNSLDPSAFAAAGSKILSDPTDYKDIQETIRGAFERGGRAVPPMSPPDRHRIAGAIFGGLWRLLGGRGQPS